MQEEISKSTERESFREQVNELLVELENTTAVKAIKLLSTGEGGKIPNDFFCQATTMKELYDHPDVKLYEAIKEILEFDKNIKRD
jgi:hypothetical protein